MKRSPFLKDTAYELVAKPKEVPYILTNEEILCFIRLEIEPLLIDHPLHYQELSNNFNRHFDGDYPIQEYLRRLMSTIHYHWYDSDIVMLDSVKKSIALKSSENADGCTNGVSNRLFEITRLLAAQESLPCYLQIIRDSYVMRAVSLAQSKYRIDPVREAHLPNDFFWLAEEEGYGVNHNDDAYTAGLKKETIVSFLRTTFNTYYTPINILNESLEMIRNHFYELYDYHGDKKEGDYCNQYSLWINVLEGIFCKDHSIDLSKFFVYENDDQISGIIIDIDWGYLNFKLYQLLATNYLDLSENKKNVIGSLLSPTIEPLILEEIISLFPLVNNREELNIFCGLIPLESSKKVFIEAYFESIPIEKIATFVAAIHDCSTLSHLQRFLPHYIIKNKMEHLDDDALIALCNKDQKFLEKLIPFRPTLLKKVIDLILNENACPLRQLKKLMELRINSKNDDQSLLKKIQELMIDHIALILIEVMGQPHLTEYSINLIKTLDGPEQYKILIQRDKNDETILMHAAKSNLQALTTLIGIVETFAPQKLIAIFNQKNKAGLNVLDFAKQQNFQGAILQIKQATTEAEIILDTVSIMDELKNIPEGEVQSLHDYLQSNDKEKTIFNLKEVIQDLIMNANNSPDTEKSLYGYLDFFAAMIIPCYGVRKIYQKCHSNRNVFFTSTEQKKLYALEDKITSYINMGH